MQKAMSDNLPKAIDLLEKLGQTQTLAELFAALDIVAKAADAKKIANHELRPDSTDATIAKMTNAKNGGKDGTASAQG